MSQTALQYSSSAKRLIWLKHMPVANTRLNNYIKVLNHDIPMADWLVTLSFVPKDPGSISGRAHISLYNNYQIILINGGRVWTYFRYVKLIGRCCLFLIIIIIIIIFFTFRLDYELFVL